MSAKEEYIKPIEEFACLAKSMDYDMECISTNDCFYIHVLNPNFNDFFALVHDSYRSMNRPLDIMKNTIKKKEENIFSFEAKSADDADFYHGFTVKFTPSNRTKK
jgi:hypothetical protein